MSILGLKFRDYGQVYYFDSGAFVVSDGDKVIVNTEQGMSLGQVVLIREAAPEHIPGDDLKSIYRLATSEDEDKVNENEELAREAFTFCRQCIQEHKLDMKLVDVEVFFDRSKIIFYFTAPNRIDFRELVKDLVKAYRTRIELRQIGVRHETQMIGAVGNCGQVCCCRRFLRKFAPVTIKMAKEQNLFLNPTKISGICGRLLCCLSYEQEMYEEFRRQCPKVGKKYVTNEGAVKVIRANLFRKSLTIIMDNGEERDVDLEEWAVLEPARPDPNSKDPGPPPRPRPAKPQRDTPRRAPSPDKRDAAPEQRESEEQAAPKSQGQGRGRDRSRGQGRSRGKGRDKTRQPEAKQGIFTQAETKPVANTAAKARDDSIPTFDVQRMSEYYREAENSADNVEAAPQAQGEGGGADAPGNAERKAASGTPKRSNRRGRRRRKKSKAKAK